MLLFFEGFTIFVRAKHLSLILFALTSLPPSGQTSVDTQMIIFFPVFLSSGSLSV